jgi:hypothetical protein
MRINKPERDMLRPAYAGDLAPAIKTRPPRPEPGGVLALPPDAAPDAALLDGPRQNRPNRLRGDPTEDALPVGARDINFLAGIIKLKCPTRPN